jgi:hypothetical protein
MRGVYILVIRANNFPVYLRDADLCRKNMQRGYYRWAIRHECFRKKLIERFTVNSGHSWVCLELCEPSKLKERAVRMFTTLYKTENNKTEDLDFSWEYPPDQPVVEDFVGEVVTFAKIKCGLPDGDYMVERAFHASGKPYFLTVENGTFDDKELAAAGAHMWWCVESQNPTGDRDFSEWALDHYEFYDFHFGGCDECYTVHTEVKSANFNVDKKIVTLETKYW